MEYSIVMIFIIYVLTRRKEKFLSVIFTFDGNNFCNTDYNNFL